MLFLNVPQIMPKYNGMCAFKLEAPIFVFELCQTTVGFVCLNRELPYFPRIVQNYSVIYAFKSRAPILFLELCKNSVRGLCFNSKLPYFSSNCAKIHIRQLVCPKIIRMCYLEQVFSIDLKSFPNHISWLQPAKKLWSFWFKEQTPRIFWPLTLLTPFLHEICVFKARSPIRFLKLWQHTVRFGCLNRELPYFSLNSANIQWDMSV